MEETLHNSSHWKNEAICCGKWAGGPTSRVWVNQWEKCTKEIMTRVKYKGKNVVDGKKVNEIN